MILVYFFMVAILFCILIIVLSSLRVSINDLCFNIYEIEYKKFRKILEYKLIIELYLLNKIPLFKLKVDNEKIRNVRLKIGDEKIEKIKSKISIKDAVSESIKELKFKIEKFNLKASIDTNSVLLTSGIVAMASSALSIALAKIVGIKNIANCKYEMKPLYKNKNMLKIDLNCIISIKLVHIIFIILKNRLNNRREKI